MLHAMNQFGGGAMSPAERARAIRDETWQSPDGTDVRRFRYDSSAGKYLGEAPPPDWDFTDRAVPVVPGMGGSQPPSVTPTAKMKEAQFLFPGDEEAQRQYVAGEGKPGKGGKGAPNLDVQKVRAALSTVRQLKEQAFSEDLQGNPTGAFRPDDTGFGGRLFAGFRNMWNSLAQPETGGGTAAENYERSKKATIATIVKAFGDTGALSEGDIKRAVESLPEADKFPDAYNYAQAAFAHLENLLKLKLMEASPESLFTPDWVAPPDAAGGNKPVSEMSIEELEAELGR
jgi:hypothetical protein